VLEVRLGVDVADPLTRTGSLSSTPSAKSNQYAAIDEMWTNRATPALAAARRNR
jgi:hypothetical protein